MYIILTLAVNAVWAPLAEAFNTITRHGTSAVFGSGKISSVAVTIPADASVGDLCLITARINNTAGFGPAPLGFTPINSYTAAIPSLIVYGKTLVPGDPNSVVTVTANATYNLIAGIQCYSGALTVVPVDVSGVNHNIQSTTATAKSITPYGNGDLLVVAYTPGTNTTTCTGSPSKGTYNIQTPGLCTVDYQLPSSAATRNQTVGLSARNSSAAMQIALFPAPASSAFTFDAQNFGSSSLPYLNRIYSFTSFGGNLYAGGRVNSAASGPTARIWQSTDNGLTWSAVASTAPPFATTDNEIRRIYGVDSTTYSYGGYIYATTQTSNGPRIYRSADGVTWDLVSTLDSDQSYGRWFVEFNGALYLGTVGTPGSTARIYQSADGTTWTPVWHAADSTVVGVHSMDVANGNIYATTDGAGTGNGGFIFGSADGTTWTKLNTNQLTGPTNGGNIAHSLIYWNGVYYIGQQDTANGGAIWSSTDLATWTKVWTAPGLRNEPEVYRLYAAPDDYVWIGTRGVVGTGGAIYKTQDFVTITPVDNYGFGSPDLFGVFDFIWSSSSLITASRTLTVGTVYPATVQHLSAP